jgi:hypothetical protein
MNNNGVEEDLFILVFSIVCLLILLLLSGCSQTPSRVIQDSDVILKCSNEFVECLEWVQAQNFSHSLYEYASEECISEIGMCR